MKKMVMAITAVVLLGGCASAGNQTFKAETQQTVAEKITEGKTTKSEVASIFGSPLTTNFTDGGLLIWKYELNLVSADAVNFIPVANLFGSCYSGTKKELVIMFDENDVVKRFSMTESEVETKSGVYN